MATASSIYQASNPLECDICSNTYNDDHCPRILPCSHEFCSSCIEGLILNQKKECPLCRTKFSSSSAEDFMISRGLLEAAKQLSSMQGGSRPSTRTPKKSILDFAKDFQENLIERGITVCCETEAEVKARTESNYRLKNELEGFTQMLAEIKFPNQEALSNIDQDNKELVNKLDIMQREQLNVKESERKLERATDSASAGATIGEAGHILLGVEKTVSEIKQLLQENEKRRDNLRQDTLRTKGTFTEAMKALGRIIEELEDEESVVNITVIDLQSPHSLLRGDAQREIFAVMTFEGTQRVAPVKIEPNNQMSVPHLEEGVLPPRCFVIELESLMPPWASPFPSPPPSSPPPRGFLDLTYGSKPLGRVIIRVTINGLKGLNFLHMCAGGMGGPSYAHSRASNVWNKGQAGESILLGNYVSFGGRGTSNRAVLSSEEDWQKEREIRAYQFVNYKEGEVMGDISYEKASEFRIITRNDESYPRAGNCFGVVEEGIEVLQTTTSKYYQDIGNVHISQCGLIL